MSTPLFDFFEEDKNIPIRKKSVRKTAIPKKSEPPKLARPMTVFELTRQVKGMMETDFSDVWVVGEISNLSRAGSGHMYLTLKDENAQLPAVMWNSAASKLRFAPANGMEVVCRGKLDVYPPQGKYQMIVSEMEPKGVGTLELAFRQLYEKLEKEGLFDKARKKPLPKFLRTVAVITSPSGAAIRDFLQVLGRRTRRIDVLLVPVRVQGDGAAEEIAEAIRIVHRVAEQRPIDCIVVTRGGGSIEDLWAFNEEILVRAVAASQIPVVSGVGHEIDVTLCDSAADVRALTPSEAAERLAPEDAELARGLAMLRRRLEDQLDKRLRLCRERLRNLETHSALARPERIFEDRRRTVDVFEERLNRAMGHRLQSTAERLGKTAAALEALSPLAVLARGYSLTETEDGRRIRIVDDIADGDRIRTRLVDGTVESVVYGLNKKEK